MTLHESLTELSDVAPTCPSSAAAKGVLAEACELARNAWAHRSDPEELAEWSSALVAAVLTSPALTETTGGVAPELTGAYGRREALPSAPVLWLSDPALPDAQLSELLAEVGLRGWSVARTPVALIDARHAPSSPVDEELLAQAVAHRPTPLAAIDGLPDRHAAVNIRHDLLLPIADLARWAAGGKAASVVSTRARLDYAASISVLDANEVDALHTAWATGLELAFGRWYDRVHDDELTLEMLPALSRSAYGEATRTLASVIRSVAARHGVDVAGKDDR